MAQVAFHLLSIRQEVDSKSFIEALRALPQHEKPLWVGQCHHWIHEPHLSQNSLLGDGPTVKSWDYVVAFKASEPDSLAIPTDINALTASKWSIITDAEEPLIEALAARLESLSSHPGPQLPPGWSAEDHKGLDESEAPADLVMSLAATSRPLRPGASTARIDLKSFTRSFGTSNPGPIAMFNLLSFVPGKKQEYFNYVAGFGDISYGGEPLVFGFDVKTWTSRAEDMAAGVWNGAALVWYPSIWNFAKMLDDPRYAELDRRYKHGVIVDNPLICCTRVEL
jgi:hypothetical protein